MPHPVPQPAKAEAALQRATIRELARKIPCSEHHLSRVLNGYERPSARIRAGLAEALGRPEALLFRGTDLGRVAS